MLGIKMKYQYKRKTLRIISMIMTLVMCFGTFQIGMIDAFAEDESTASPFTLKLSWNGDVPDKTKYVYDSTSDESRYVRLKVAYENKNLPQTYRAGQIVITVPGINDAARNGTLTPAGIAADPSAAKTKSYDWSYTYNSKTNIYTFTNNAAVRKGSVLDGMFEIIWDVSSRTSKNGYTASITANMTTYYDEEVTSNTITYEQSRQRDEYILTPQSDIYVPAKTMYRDSGGKFVLSDDEEPEQFAWVHYTDFTYNGVPRARGRVDHGPNYPYKWYSDWEIWVLDQAIFYGEGFSDTGKTKVDGGRTYKAYKIENKDIYQLQFYVLYPKNIYPDLVRVDVDAVGTFLDETEEVVYASAQYEINVEKYPYRLHTGSLYNIYKNSYGMYSYSKYTRNHCAQCYRNGAINSLHMANGKGTYDSSLEIILNTETLTDTSYEIEMTDDFLDVQTTDGSYRQLNDNEYNFTGVTVPSTTSLVNMNNIKIDRDPIPVKIYLRKANESEYKLWKDIFTQDNSQVLTLSDSDEIVGIRIVVADLKQSISYDSNFAFYVHYKFHTNANDIQLMNGSVVNNVSSKIYHIDKNGERSSIGGPYSRENYSSDREYQRDIDTYGEALMRKKDETHIIVIPNSVSNYTWIEQVADDKSTFFFKGESSSHIITEGDAKISDFYVCTILPKYMDIQKLYADSDKFLEHIVISLSGNTGDLTADDLKSHASVQIQKNYKNSGRTYISIHFTLGDKAFATDSEDLSVYISEIPLMMDKDILRISEKSMTHSFAFKTVTLINQPEIWYGDGKDSLSDDDGIWSDINQNGSTDESIAYESCGMKVFDPMSSQLEYGISVSTDLSNAYMVPDYNKETDTFSGEDIPATYGDHEYTYRLKFRSGQGYAGRILLVDNIENATYYDEENGTTLGSEWQGYFQDIDISAAEAAIGAKGTVYYSSEIYNDIYDQRPDDLENENGIWKTNPYELWGPVRSIAVDFGEGVLTSEKTAFVEIRMRAPENYYGDLNYQKTINDSVIYYDSIDENSKVIIQPDVRLESNKTAVMIEPFKGDIIINKLGYNTNEPIEGAEFALYSYNDNSVVRSNIVTGKDGKAKISDVPYGYYYIKETKYPKGYITHQEIEKDMAEDYDYYNTHPDYNEWYYNCYYYSYRYGYGVELYGYEPGQVQTVEFYNQRKLSDMTFKKVSDRGKTESESGDVTYKINISGAQFRLYTPDGKYATNDTYVSDEDGKIKISGIPWGSYYLLESKAPAGYKKYTKKIEFTVDASNDAGRELNINIENEQYPAEVTLTKYEVTEDGTKTSNPLKNAVYNFYNSDDELMGTYVTDKNGEIYIDDLTYGTYYFVETIAPKGYQRDATPVSFTIGPDDLNEENVATKVVKVYDNRLKGNLWLEKRDNKGAVVEKASYGLFNASTNQQVNEKGEPSKESYLTNSQGILEITGLYWGEYYIKEVDAPHGYQLNDTQYSFTLDASNVRNTVVINATDERVLGKVKLLKVNASDEPLPGAVYELYKSDASLVKENIVTGADGTALVEGLEWGSYYFLEKTPPVGYGLSDEKVRFSVNNISAGKTQEITAVDKEASGVVSVKKKIKIQDIVFEHGAPTFLFQLSGKDVYGNDYTAYRSMTFSEEYIKQFKQDNPTKDYVELSTVFADVPVGTGTMTLSEVDAIRYDVSDITSDKGIVTIDATNKTAAIQLDAMHMEAAVTYSNSKYVQSKLSHNGHEQNIIKIGRKLTAISAVWAGDKYVSVSPFNHDDLNVYLVYDDGTTEKLNKEDYTLTVEGEALSDLVPYNHSDITVKVTYVDADDHDKEYYDTFDLSIRLQGNFTYKVTEKTFTDTNNGVTYDGTAVITGYIGNETTEEIYSDVYGKLTLLDYDGNYTRKNYGERYKVVGIEGYKLPEGYQYNDEYVPKDFPVCAYRFDTLEELTIPNSVTEIGDYSFESCDSLKTIHLSNSLTTIGAHAFDECTNLTAVSLPVNVQTIGNQAFYHCSKAFGTSNDDMMELELPNTTIVGDSAFCGTFVERADFGDQVPHIGTNAFDDTPVITQERYSYNHVMYLHPDYRVAYGLTSESFSDDLTFADSAVSIADFAFAYNHGYGSSQRIYNIYIPASVQWIGNGAFYLIANYGIGSNSNSGQIYIDGETSKERVGDKAFFVNSQYNYIQSQYITVADDTGWNSWYMEGAPVKQVDVSYNYSSIENGLDSTYSTRADKVTIDEDNPWYTAKDGIIYNKQMTQIISIASGFSGDLNLPDNIDLEEAKLQALYNVTNINIGANSDAYVSIDGVLFSKDRTRLIRFPSGRTGEYVIPDGVKTIEAYAFHSSKLSSVTIPSGVQKIGNYAFASCEQLTSIIIPDGVTSIGNYAFGWCYALAELVIPGSVTDIGQGAFIYCRKLEDLVIPNGVVNIGRSAFYQCLKLKNLTFPESIKSIGAEAFNNCTAINTITISGHTEDVSIYGDVFNGCYGLTAIVVDDDNPNLSTDGGVLYDGSKTTLIRCPQGKTGSIDVPGSVTSIGDYAFYQSKITNVTLSDGLTSIGASAFRGSSLRKIEIPDSVTEIGTYAFYYCSSMSEMKLSNNLKKINEYTLYGIGVKSLVVPGSVKSIEKDGIRYCLKLESITINEGVESIGEEGLALNKKLVSVTLPNSMVDIGKKAFSQCTALTSITLPDSVIYIRDQAFSGCTTLTEVNLPEAVNIYSTAFDNTGLTKVTENGFQYIDNILIKYTGSSSAASVTIPNHIKYIANSVFREKQVKSVTLPDGLTSIGEYAFYYCSSLTSVTVPDSLRCIGDYAFCGSTKLTTITIPDEVTYIGAYGFLNCSKATGLTIPSHLKSINASVFYGCSLTDITIPDGITSIGSSAFYGCNKATNLTIPNSVTSIGSYAFSFCTKLPSVTIPGSVKSIGNEAFSSCYGAQSLTIQDGVTSIGNRAFANCSNRQMKSVVIPDSVTKIGSEVFSSCPYLETLVVSKNITSIADKAFSACTGLKEVTIPDTVANVGGSAFTGCWKLETIHLQEDSDYVVDDGVLFNKTKTRLIRYLKNASRRSYTIPDSVKTIDSCAFYSSFRSEYEYGLGLTGSITIPDSVTSIGDYAFYYNSASGLSIPASAESIGQYAFAYCTNLTDVTIPGSVKTVNKYTFTDCTQLGNVTICNGVESIDEKAFHNCSSITSIVIPDSVTKIGTNIFSECTGLKEVTFPDMLLDIAGSALTGCVNLTDIYVYGNSDNYTSINGILFSKDKTKLILYPPGRKDESYVVPKNVISIGKNAFNGSAALKTLTISENAVDIPYSLGSAGVETLIVDSDLTISNDIYKTVNGERYKTELFCKDMSNLKTLIINGNACIQDRAFENQIDNLTHLENLIIKGQTSIGNYAFASFSWIGSDYNYETGDYEEVEYGLKRLDLTGVTGIGDYAFEKCQCVENVLFGESLVTIGKYAFSSSYYNDPACIRITELDLPDSLRSIGPYAFANCTGITKLHMSKNLETLGSYAFSGCPIRNSVLMPDSLKYVAEELRSSKSQIPSGNIMPDISSFVLWIPGRFSYQLWKNDSTDVLTY